MNVVERSSVEWGTTNIPYSVRRSRRRGTVSIAIDPQEGVLVTAPVATTLDKLNSLVRSKAPWIVQRLRRQSDLLPPPARREFVSGETFRYLGRQHRLRVEQGAGGVHLRGGYLHVSVLRKSDAEQIRRALIRWYRQHAAERLPQLATTWATKVGVTLSTVVLREQRRRWGSCDRAGGLRLNWRVVQAPRACIEYVVAHEVAHVRHPNHTAAFWAALGRVMPNYEARRARLRALGASLIW